jgi:hypothetical protein
MRGNIEVNDLSSVVAKDDHGVEQAKRRCYNNEHVDRRNVRQVVMQKATPSRGGNFGCARKSPGKEDENVI